MWSNSRASSGCRQRANKLIKIIKLYYLFRQFIAFATALCGCLAASFVPADTPGPGDHAALLTEAIAALGDDFKRDWAFTETAVQSERTTVGRFDPRRPEGERWTLVTVDGREPTGEEIDEFLSEKAKERGDSGDDGETSVRGMVEPDTLRLVEETADYWLFSFVPDEDEDGEEFAAAMDGTLRIAKDGRYLEYIDIRNTKPFKPQFGVKINEFMTRLRFGPADGDGAVVPLSVDIKVDVRAFLVKRVRETISITFDEHEFVGK